jgi:hypothetical protein
VTLRDPLNLNRADADDYVSLFSLAWQQHRSCRLLLISAQSLCELKILNTLGVSSLPDWKITKPRARWMSRSRPGKDTLIMEEVERLKAHAEQTGRPVVSMHVHGPVPYQVVVPLGSIEA